MKLNKKTKINKREYVLCICLFKLVGVRPNEIDDSIMVVLGKVFSKLFASHPKIIYISCSSHGIWCSREVSCSHEKQLKNL